MRSSTRSGRRAGITRLAGQTWERPGRRTSAWPTSARYGQTSGHEACASSSAPCGVHMSRDARPSQGYGNLGNMLRAQPLERPEQTACVFIDGQGKELGSATYADIDRHARALAVTLGERVSPGNRVLIMCPPGIDFLAGFFACQYAGLITVPVVCPDAYNDGKGTRARLAGIVKDCTPAAALASADVAERLSAGDLGDTDVLPTSHSVPELAGLWRGNEQRSAPPPRAFHTSWESRAPQGVGVSATARRAHH